MGAFGERDRSPKRLFDGVDGSPFGGPAGFGVFFGERDRKNDGRAGAGAAPTSGDDREPPKKDRAEDRAEAEAEDGDRPKRPQRLALAEDGVSGAGGASPSAT